MPSNEFDQLDGVTIGLLMRGLATKPDIPVKFIKSLSREYAEIPGYRFSWGAVSEVSSPSDPDDDESPLVLRFEFMPISLLLVFPESGQLEDLFMWMYENHPLYDPDFDCDEGNNHWSVISFASGGGEGEALRDWVADAFIPLIWPDLLAEATKIVEKKIEAAISQSPDGTFEELLVERHRYQLCDDPAKLSFNLDK
ncbi:hypothetical protein [Herbaspirillum sp. SJZ107]|uniref:hypothetical protein n=1 Tax=Herbaspirillum sp. SJZ107 TaxID=2572881 RepID=UPI0011515043|nr:hypothetical protein [Herbaspirillum sp. SJZ107]TQK01260.1 hypothetical protein FBX97_5789 [Herbaspirillum sp. SJZ107]